MKAGDPKTTCVKPFVGPYYEALPVPQLQFGVYFEKKLKFPALYSTDVQITLQAVVMEIRISNREHLYIDLQ